MFTVLKWFRKRWRAIVPETHYRKVLTQRLSAVGSRVTDRQERIPHYDQRALTECRGVMIGGGGIGGEVAEGLCRKGIGHLLMLDRDSVDISNLNRQPFIKRDIGRNKALCLVKRLAPHCHAGTVLEGYAWHFQDALALGINLSGTFVVCGVDNGRTRVAVSEYYRLLGIPVIFIAVDLTAECGYVAVQESKPNTPCFGCFFPNTMNGARVPCVVPACKDILKVTAGLALYAIDTLLMDRKRNWNYRRIHLAGFAPTFERMIEKNPACPLCSEK